MCVCVCVCIYHLDKHCFENHLCSITCYMYVTCYIKCSKKSDAFTSKKMFERTPLLPK